jgi:glutathione S-transferase
MLLQTQRAKGAQSVDGENLLWRPIREKRDRDRDQSAHKVRIAVASKMKDRLAGGARSRLPFQPYLTDAAPHLVDFIVGCLAKRLEAMTEFDDIAIAILPIVEGGEIVADGLEISQAILAYARALKELRSQPFWRPIDPIGRAAKRGRPSPHQSPSPGFGEKYWSFSGFPSHS